MNLFKTSLHPTVVATNLLLKELKVSVTLTTINETVQNHPEFPSLLCISDALDQWNVENAAVTVSTENVLELPTPFLATIRSSGEQIWVLVKEINETTVRYSNSLDQQKDVATSVDDFLKQSTGVALLAEANESSGEPRYWANRRKKILSQIAKVSLLVAFVLIGVIGFFKFTLQQSPDHYALTYLLFWSTKSIGIFLSLLLVWYAIDESNPILKKVCSAANNGDCNSVINSKYSKLLGRISWTDISLAYFVGGLICLLTTTGSSVGIFILGWLSVFAVPYTIFSIYVQGRVLKKWCVLCLAVQGILLVEAFISIIFAIRVPFELEDYLPLWAAMLSFIMPILSWYLIKPVLTVNYQNKAAARNLIRLTSNRQIFHALMQQQKELSHDAGNLGLILGNADSDNVLVVVSDPLCGHCADIHPEIEQLLELRRNLRIQLLFNNGPGEQRESSRLFVNYLLTIYNRGDKTAAGRILSEWYKSSTKDYTQFMKTHPNIELDQMDSVEAMEHWCNSVGISGTPTLFFNRKQLPEIFKVTDLKYFLATQ